MGVAVLRAGIVLCRLGRLCPSVAVELGAGPICRNLGDLKLAVIVWIGILLAILVEWGAVDNERKPCGVGRGRDIAVTPAPESGPFNYFFGPHLEVEGKQVPVKATFEFKRLPLKD